MNLFWFLTSSLLVIVLGSNLDTLECPLPGGPSTESEEECNLYPACSWSDPNCVMLKNTKSGYSIRSQPVDTGRGFQMALEKIDPAVTMFDGDVTHLTFEAIYHENYHLQIKIYDSNNDRYEVPIPLNLPTDADADQMYSIGFHNENLGDTFAFNISRKSTGTVIFKMMGPIIFEDQFLQFSTFLSSSYVYGLGENPHATFKHDFTTRTTTPIFPRDQPVGTGDFNQYGTHPYFVNIEDDEGNTNSMLLYSSNAMEYSTFSTTDGKPAITFRTIGGILDLHFFLGPYPEDVNWQYAITTGTTNFPPYWALGFQLSRYGYNTLDNLKTVRQRMKDLGIPQDGQTCDIDYMYRWRDFTYDPINWDGFPEYINELQDDGVKVTLMLDPAIVTDFSDAYLPAKHGKEQDVFIKWLSDDLVPDDQPSDARNYIVGYVWPDNKTVFPDFLNPKTHDWWNEEIQTLHSTLPFDALWIDMNEPANFGTNLDRPFNYPEELPDWSLKCPYTSLDSPPFPTKATYQNINECQRLSDKTICMSATQTDGINNYTHYDVHSLFGISESIATHKALDNLFPSERHELLARSTFPGSGHYISHWLGDNSADWLQMRMSIVGLMEFSLFNIHHAGADICGFSGEPSEELCARWTQLGAFYPFSRNHNAIGMADQDPARPDWPIVNSVARDVLLFRYKYIPYLYTLFHKSNVYGYSVVRPLFNEFYTDLSSRDIDDQFLWGSNMMIAPVLYESAINRNIYFPWGNWYDLVDGTLTATGPISSLIDAPIEKIPVYIRGGAILPFQYPNVTTEMSRLNNLGLTVALDSNGTASGDLFWDDGRSISQNMSTDTFMASFYYSENELSMTIEHGNSVVEDLILEEIDFFGYPTIPSEIDVNGTTLDASAWSYDDSTKILQVTILQPLAQEFSMKIL